MALASFVASTQFWRLLEMARPTTCSELPFEYASAVSIKLMPASRAFATIRVDVASSVGPLGLHRHCERSEAIHGCKELDCFVASLLAMTGVALRLVLQYLKHTAGHDDTAVAGGHLRGHENQAAGGAHHPRPGRQDLADLAGIDKVGVELDGGQRRPARYVSRGHAAAAVRERHQQPALHQAAAVVVLVLRDQRIFVPV